MRDKKCAPKFLLFNEKKIRKIWIIFDIKNHFESPILEICDEVAKLGKASWDTYYWGGWMAF